MGSAGGEALPGSEVSTALSKNLTDPTNTWAIPFTVDGSPRRILSCFQVPNQDKQPGVPRAPGWREHPQAQVQGVSVAATELENGVFNSMGPTGRGGTKQLGTGTLPGRARLTPASLMRQQASSSTSHSPTRPCAGDSAYSKLWSPAAWAPQRSSCQDIFPESGAGGTRAPSSSSSEPADPVLLAFRNTPLGPGREGGGGRRMPGSGKNEKTTSPHSGGHFSESEREDGGQVIDSRCGPRCWDTASAH